VNQQKLTTEPFASMALTGITTNLGLTNIGANHPENESAASSLSSIINALAAALDAAIGNVEVKSADGAIASTQGTVIVTKGTAAAITLAAPAAGLPAAAGNDGQMLRIVLTTAAAHVVTFPTNKLNGNKTTATFGAAAGNAIVLVAYQGVWYTVATIGQTLA
jgi:hypothetical protein